MAVAPISVEHCKNRHRVRSSVAAGMCILAALAATVGARADAPAGGETLILQDWGIYAGKPVRQVPSPESSSGAYLLSENEHLLRQTHTVCAALGTDFGLRFRLSTARPELVLPLTVEVTHPPLSNGEGQKQTLDTFTHDVVPGRLSYIGWIFTDPSELTEGNWRFVLRGDEGTVLLDESFTVTTSCQPLIS
jgi:hypothetical protein